MIDDTLFDAEEKMEKAVLVVKDDLSTLRTGRANPNMFGRIVIDYYGAPTPLTQMATINIPEARMAVIKPYDAGQLRRDREGHSRFRSWRQPGHRRNRHPGGVPAAHRAAPTRVGQDAPGKGEDAKVSIRNIRRKAKDTLDKMSKDGEAGEDDVARAEKELQSLTDQYVAQVDDWSSTRKPSCSRSDERADSGRGGGGGDSGRLQSRAQSAGCHCGRPWPRRDLHRQPADLPAELHRDHRCRGARLDLGITVHAAAARGISISLVPVAVGSVAVVALVWPYGQAAQGIGPALTALACLVWRFGRGSTGYLADVSASIFVTTYLGLFASFATLMLVPDDGAQRILTFMILVVCSDTGGYIAGVLFGKHPMAPKISPKKSWEGFTGSVSPR